MIWYEWVALIYGAGFAVLFGIWFVVIAEGHTRALIGEMIVALMVSSTWPIWIPFLLVFYSVMINNTKTQHVTSFKMIERTLILVVVIALLYAIVGGLIASTANLPKENYEMIDKQQRIFRDRVVTLAKISAPKFGLDWRLMAATAILETGWGKSELAGCAHNLFGIKATGSTSEDDVYLFGGERFQKFASDKDAFFAYGRLMSRSSHYEDARRIARDTALDVFVAYLAPVYCPTDPEYHSKIMSLVEMLNHR